MAQGALHKAMDHPARPDWASRPRYALSDIVVLLWRERFLMVAVFMLVFVAGLAAAMTMKTVYPAYASILVRLGQEYVYEPLAGDAGRGQAPESDQLIQSETEILGSAQLKQRVIARLGLPRIFPDLAKKYAAATPAEKQKMEAEAITGMQRRMRIETAPDTPIIRVGYDDADPKNAALVLNTLLEEYLAFRRNVLLDRTSPALEQQRREFEARLGEADRAYEDFLSNNRIGDFTAEKASLSQLQAQIEQQRYAAEAQLQDREGRLAALNAQMAGVAPEIGLYRDVSGAAGEKLAALRVQREDLLSRYQPTSRVVTEVDAQIAQMERAMNQGRTTTEGAKRFGVNPVFQTLQTEKIQITSEIAALRDSLGAMQGQVDQLTERRLRLAELEPEFQNLSLDRDVLQANVRDFTVKEQQTRAAQEIAASSNDNIRIVQRAVPATQGKSLKKPVAILALLFAGFTALCAGLARMFLRPGIPTARSASRTLDLPVLGQAMSKGA
ncbi:MAG: GumC family protein [Caulobacteraceae bacterium]|nr:GumC family protein [Caulobacteraceae bacterium]